MKLSVLDQLPIANNSNGEQAFQNALDLAAYSETLDYERFWVSEHHAAASLASSAPEILVAALSQVTKSIRLGTGGIMLPHYSSYKIAEVANTLGCLAPGRIDLGVGRAPGTDMISARALSVDGQPRFHHFPQQVNQLSEMLNTPDYRPRISPRPEIAPTLWMLGSGPESSELAAHLGLPYNLAYFINPQATPEIFDYYRQNYKPSEEHPKPLTSMAIACICADTEAEAQHIALTHRMAYVKLMMGRTDKLMHPDEVAAIEFEGHQAGLMEYSESRLVIGSPEQVYQELDNLANKFGADELMIGGLIYDHEKRKSSYQLIKEVFDAITDKQGS